MFYLHLIHYIGFIGAQIFNSILALLIVKRAGKLFGAYRHVMLFFTLCTMWFSWVEIVTQPLMYTKGSMMVVFLDHYHFSKTLGALIISVHCGSFAFLISVFAAQFFYRYCVLCGLKILKFLEGNRVFLIFTPCFAVFLFFIALVFWGGESTEEKLEYLKDGLEQIFYLDADSVSFIALYYWQTGFDGEKVWNVKDLLTCAICVVIICIVSWMILFFAFKIYKHMTKSSAHLSQKTLELNRQLFIMLTVQTIVPFVLMYIPIGFILGFPLFSLSLGEFVNYGSASIALYPMIEPLVAMFCISDFRKVIRSDKSIGGIH